MNDEKKYKKAIEVAKECLQDGNITTIARAYIWEIFPELKESEDERMRKALYADIRTYIPNERGDKYIAWLEEQGKHAELGQSEVTKTSDQELSDKVEPKFKAGDWIVDDKTPNDVFCVIEVLGEIYKVIDIDGDDYHIPHCKADKQFHLWTIQDAKDGDVLVNYLECGKCIAIFKSIITDDKMYDTEIYCHLINDLFISKSGYSNATWEPATKEQRDLLFQKMKDAGYGWDSDKKELRKIQTTLDPDKVIEWLEDQACQGWIEDVEVEKFVDKFKKDFGL